MLQFEPSVIILPCARPAVDKLVAKPGHTLAKLSGHFAPASVSGMQKKKCPECKKKCLECKDSRLESNTEARAGYNMYCTESGYLYLCLCLYSKLVLVQYTCICTIHLYLHNIHCTAAGYFGQTSIRDGFSKICNIVNPRIHHQSHL